MDTPVTVRCPGCGVVLPASGIAPEGRYNASFECQLLCGDLADDPIIGRDPDFIYQLVVDAYGAQHAGPTVRPIGTAFALLGLYLHCERGYTGKRVQQAHVALARQTKQWPRFTPPERRGQLTIHDVVRGATRERHDVLEAWARTVWEAWAAEHATIARLAARYLP